MDQIDEVLTSEVQTIPADGRVALDSLLLKAHRSRLGLSQEALAEYCFSRRLCVSIATIKRAESGKAILYRTARHLAAAYEVSLETLITIPSLNPTHIEKLPIRTVTSPYPGIVFAVSPDDQVSRTVVVLALPLGEILTPAQRDAAALTSSQFGGTTITTKETEWAAVFGIPQAYGSDAARCLECAITLLQRAGPTLNTVLVGLGEWSYGELHLPESFIDPSFITKTNGTEAKIIVERTCSAMVTKRFNFDAIDKMEHDYPFVLLRIDRANSDCPDRPLIARFAQLEQFKAILDDAQSTQCGQFVHVRGVAGIGKSRLLREFRAVAHDWGFVCYDITIHDFGSITIGTPWGQLVHQLLAQFQNRETADSAGLEEKIRLANVGTTQEMLLRNLVALPQPAEQESIFEGMEHAARRRSAAEAIQTLLLCVAITTPVVILVEDVHWADASFLELFAILLPLTADAAITWITTSRHEDDPLDMHLRPHCQNLPLTVFDLPPLRRIEAEALALQHLNVSAEHRLKCIDRANGNSLFLTQLLLSPPERDLPDSLRHLVQAQLDRLPAQDREALRVASTIGQQFSLELLREILDAPYYVPELPRSANLLKQSLGDNCSFVHDLVMQCIYESAPLSRRQCLHGRLASHFRDLDTALWAHHLDCAKDPAAPAAYLRAIREELRFHAYARANDLVEQCRRINYAPIDHYGLEMLAAEAAASTMRSEDARVSYERARELAPTPVTKLNAILGLAATLNVLDRTDDEDSLLNDAMPLAREVGSDALISHLLYLKGNIRFPRGEIAAGRELHEQALQYARSGGAHHLEALSLSGLGDSLYAEGRMSEANKEFSDCLVICRKHELASIEASNLFMLGTTRIYLGQTKEALVDALESASLGRRVGNRRAEIVSRLTASWVLLSMGRLDEARNEVEEGLQIARSMGAARFEPFLGECLARLSFLDGRRSLALEQIIAACDAMERLKLQTFIGPWLLGTLALLTDDVALRRTALQRGSKILEHGCVAHNRYRFHVAAAEIALLDGDAKGAALEMVHLQAATSGDSCEWVDHQVRIVHSYGKWIANPCDDTRANLYDLHRRALRAGLALVTPRLDAALRGL